MSEINWKRVVMVSLGVLVWSVVLVNLGTYIGAHVVRAAIHVDSDDDGTDDHANKLQPATKDLPTWELVCPSEGWGTTCIHHNLRTGEMGYVTPPEGAR